MRKLKERIICEKFMIIGCIILIGVYTGGVIGSFISPKTYFSDFWSSTIAIVLVVIILLLTIENHSIHLRLLREK